MMELKNVTKSFGGIKAVDNVSFYFSPKNITALIGPNGAGKTTVFNLISGFIKPDKGEILFKGEPITNLPPWEIANRGIGRIFQDVRIFEKLTCLENVLLAKKSPAENPLNLFLTPKKIKEFEEKNIEEAKYWLDFVGLSGKENTLAENLSYGQQKLLAIARLMSAEYEFLLLDEPTSGVNPAMIKVILDLIKKLVKEKDKTVVIIEHNMRVIMEMADFVYFMNEGRVETFGSPKDVLSDIRVKEEYTGL
jgi:ABC-type branched-subunit amino acid transport system ATPase component